MAYGVPHVDCEVKHLSPKWQHDTVKEYYYKRQNAAAAAANRRYHFCKEIIEAR